MSVQFICKPELFNKRLSESLGLNCVVEAGTTYFLCTDFSEIPGLVSSHDPASLAALNGVGKVRILICKENPEEGASFQTVKNVLFKSTTTAGSNPGLSSEVEETIKIKTETDAKVSTSLSDGINFEVKQEKAIFGNNFEVKQEKAVFGNACSTTSTSDRASDPPTATIGKGVHAAHTAPVVVSSATGASTLSNNGLLRVTGSSSASSTQVSNNVSAETSSKNSSLPCPMICQELKQAIIKRRLKEGKGEIDIKKEMEEDSKRQEVQMTAEENNQYLRRRELNNVAAKRCRAKRKFEEKIAVQELKRLNDRRCKLTEIVDVLESQKKFFRAWASGNKNVDNDTINKMMKSVSESETLIKELPTGNHNLHAVSGSMFSGFEYSSDDTRNSYELDSSQDTNDSTDIKVEAFSEIREILAMAEDTSNIEIGEVSIGTSETVISVKDSVNKQNEDSDSDLEMIEIDKPLVIDID